MRSAGSVWGSFVACITLLAAGNALAAIINVACPGVGTPLQNAIDAAGVGDVIQFTGQCEENILIRNEKQRLTITGTGVSPSLLAPSGTIPAINVRGKGILIQNFTLHGGRDGIHVNRGSNAVIDNMIIATGGLANIRVDQQSFAAVTNTTITTSNYGIFVDGGSDVRVGFNQDTDAAPSPNSIRSGVAGIWVQGSSRARIAGNVIKLAANFGIAVRQNSTAEIGGNDISSNGDHGVGVLLGGSVDFSPNYVGSPAFMQAPNNSNTGSNGVLGVLCQTGSYVAGTLGTLTGFTAAKLVQSPCQDLAS